MSLRHRLISLIALVLLASLAAGGVVMYGQAVRKIETEMAAALGIGASIVNEALANQVADDGGAAVLERIFSSFENRRHIRVSLVDTSGAVLRQSRLQPSFELPPDWLRQFLAGPPHVTVVSLREKTGAQGTLRIETDPENELAEVWEDARTTLGLLTLFCALVLGLVYWVLDRALQPLENLRAAFTEIGHGNFEAKVSEAGPEEFKTIYRQFNRMGAELADSERRNRSLNEQLSSVQEEERADIARDLHDEIGPFLFAVDVDAQTIPAYIERGDVEEASERASAIRQSVKHMQLHLRSILGRLRPAMLLDLGLSHAIEQLAGFWRRRRPEINISTAIAQTSFGDQVDGVAFRVVQEAVNNAIRHGNPDRIEISVGVKKGSLLISVSDNGSGLKSDKPGFGLSGMRERLAALGGSLRIESNPAGKGVRLLAELPLRPAEIATVSM